MVNDTEDDNACAGTCGRKKNVQWTCQRHMKACLTFDGSDLEGTVVAWPRHTRPCCRRSKLKLQQ